MANSKRLVEPDLQPYQSQNDSNQQNKRQKTSSESPDAKGIGLLDEEEKKARHIASEKKRREAIRNAFDKLVELVPSLTPAESRTEVSVLTKCKSFITRNFLLLKLYFSLAGY